MRRLRICLIANCRFPIREPFVGGLESMTAHLARELVRRGHDVTLFAAPGSDERLGVTEMPVELLPSQQPDGRWDTHAPPAVHLAEHHAYLSLMRDLADADSDFDIVHNNSLHHLPVAMAHSLQVPVLTTLHTPPLEWLESAIHVGRGAGSFVAVSDFTAQAWSPVAQCTTILNGVDLVRWPVGAGGPDAVWSGRIVPEKAPHEAVDAARLAGMRLVLAGPILDAAYFRQYLAPRLHGDDVTYAGHLSQRSLAALVGSSALAVVTPAWDEPYGLVAAEAMSCGTPVAAYARGALPELVTQDTGRLARPGDVPMLAAAMQLASGQDRKAVRNHAVTHLSLERMVDDYERIYADLTPPGVAA